MADLIKTVLLAFLGSVFPVILFNIDRHKIIYCGIGGALGWLVYSLFVTTLGAVGASFFGAFAVNAYSEILARKLKTPASMFYIPGIFPLVPGITAFQTIIAIVEKNLPLAVEQAILMLSVAGAIAFGVMLSTQIFKLKAKRRPKNQ
ncbi:MAG: threonine/serine exporter family protein [Oscillospiraceae bacterium]|nr:threonine/serine exporter family protein [Oscillospiraceae bacterium]